MAEGHFERLLWSHFMCGSAEPWSQGVAHSVTRNLSLCYSAPPRYVPWLSLRSAESPGHAAAPESRACLSIGCNCGDRSCAGAKACHAVWTTREGGDMGKRGTAEWKFGIAAHCLLSKRYWKTKAEI